MKSSFKGFCQNIKLEIAAVILYVFLCIVGKTVYHNWGWSVELVIYFTADRLNGITAFFAITVGVYIAVITVLATSKIGISKEMLKRNLDRPLINTIIVGIIEDMISVGLSIFVPINQISVHILIMFLVISIISFCKFIVLLITIFKVNMNEMAKEIDAEERYNDELLGCMKEILRQIKIKS